MRMTLIVAAAIACCVGLLAVAKLSAQRPQASHPPTNGTVLVDMSAIMKRSARFNESMEQLKKQYEVKAEELKRDGERGNQLAEELRKLPSSDPQRKKLEQQILQMRADFELKGKKVTNDIRDSESKIIQGLLGELRRELKRYGRAKGVQLILRHDPTPPELTDPRMIMQEIHKPIVYQSGSDVTSAILGALNRGAPPAGAPRTSRTPAPSRPVRR